MQVDRGKAHQLKGAQRSAVTVRVWNSDGRVGITSCSDLSADGLAQALSGAAEASAFGDLQDPPDLSPRSTEALEPLKREPQATRPIQEMVQTLISAEQRLLDSHPSIGTVPYNGLSQRRGERVYLNSLGARRHEERSSASLYLYARAEEAGRKPRSAGAVRLGHGTGELDVQGCIDEAAELTISHLDYAPIDTGTYTCVFSPEAFLDLMGPSAICSTPDRSSMASASPSGSPWVTPWPCPSSAFGMTPVTPPTWALRRLMVKARPQRVCP